LSSSALLTPAPALEPRSAYLHPGQLLVSATPCSISTILGSCVAVCVWDEETGIGGMNHYLLPNFAGRGSSSARFGNVAIEMLLGKLADAGARRSSMRAKVFGGANVLEALRGVGGTLGRQNVEVARRQLLEAQIPVVGEDVEGDRGRKLIFRTDDGSAKVRLLSGDRHARA
jgi:chemotaxis protein CheD